MEENLFCTYEQALALKELGFNEPCLYTYYFDGTVGLEIGWANYNITDELCSRPLKSQVFKWFRDNYKIQSLVQEYLLNTYMYTIDDGINSDISIVGFETYEEAESACIDKLIEIIKTF